MVWLHAQVASVSNLTATIQAHGRTALNLPCPVIEYLIPRATSEPEGGSSPLTTAQVMWVTPRLFSN
jgi:hypothetical protein